MIIGLSVSMNPRLLRPVAGLSTMNRLAGLLEVRRDDDKTDEVRDRASQKMDAGGRGALFASNELKYN